MNRSRHIAESRAPWVCGALVLVACTIVLLTTPTQGVWTVDCGSKALQAQRLLDSGYRSFDLEYAGRAFDPTGRWFPAPPPYAQRHGERFFAQYPVVYAATAAPFLAALGPVGLRVPAALGLAACAALFAVWVLPVFGWRWSLATALLVALATPLAFYGITIWEHTPALALALGAQLLATDPDRRRLAGAGLLMGLACWLREEMFLMGIALAVAVYAFRRRPVDLLWLALGALPAAVVLLAFNASVLGHPLGTHITGNVGSNHAPTASEALRAVGAILAGYGTGAAEAAVLGLLLPGCWIAGALASRSSRALAPVVVALAAVSLAAWLAAAVRLADADHPILVLSRTNGFLLRMPLVALAGAGVALVFRRPELAPLRFGVGLGACFLLLALPFRVLLTDFLPGLHWAPRMLLPAVPAFAVLGLVAIREVLLASSRPWRPLAVAAAAGFAVAGVISSGQAIWLLNGMKQETRELERVLLAVEPEVVVTDQAAFGLQLAGAWGRKPLLLVAGGAELALVAADLERAGVRSFAYLARPRRDSQPVEVAGLRCEPEGLHRGERIPAVFDVVIYTCRLQPVRKS